MAKISAQGTTFQFTDDLAALQTVGELISYSGFDGEASEEDITTLASTAIEVFIGLQDYGTVAIELFYDPADVGQLAMSEARAISAERECVLTLPGPTVLTFNAAVKTFPISGNKNEKLKSSVNLRISGPVVVT